MELPVLEHDELAAVSALLCPAAAVALVLRQAALRSGFQDSEDYRGDGAQRPDLRVQEPQKTGARRAWARSAAKTLRFCFHIYKKIDCFLLCQQFELRGKGRGRHPSE